MKTVKQVNFENLTLTATQVAQALKGGEVLALTGPLGAGKTTFMQNLGQQLKVKGSIPSPTFTLMRAYPATLKTGKKITLYHLDIYRCQSFQEVKQLGLDEFWFKPDSVVAIEWADKIRRHLPTAAVWLKFKNPYGKK
jgi:tRNA threonylcarbamoyladenosine biosynthesis protein TsaE